MSHTTPITLLVRLWHSDEPEKKNTCAVSDASDSSERALRIMALDPHTGERWGFATLEELLAFFQRRLEARQ